MTTKTGLGVFCLVIFPLAKPLVLNPQKKKKKYFLLVCRFCRWNLSFSLATYYNAKMLSPKRQRWWNWVEILRSYKVNISLELSVLSAWSKMKQCESVEWVYKTEAKHPVSASGQQISALIQMYTVNNVMQLWHSNTVLNILIQKIERNIKLMFWFFSD